MSRVNFASFKFLVTLISCVFVTCASGSLSQQLEDFEVLCQEMTGFFPPSTIQYVKNRTCDKAIQEAMKRLLSPESEVKRPDCLEISNVATLMELTVKFKYDVQAADHLEFLKLAKNHNNNTPPYFMNLPTDMPKEAREALFQRLRKQIDQDVQGKKSWQKLRAPALSRGLNPSEESLKVVCKENYKYLYAILFGRLAPLRKGMGWMEVMARNIIEQNTLQNFISPGPDVSKLTPENVLEFKSIPCLLEAGKSGFANIGPRIQEIKNIYPLIVFLDKYTGSEHSILSSLHEILFQLEMAYASTQQYLNSAVDNFAYFLELRESGQFDQNFSESWQKLVDRYSKNETLDVEFCKKREELVKQEYAAIEEEVDTYYDAIVAAKKEAQRLEREKKQQSKQQKNERIKEKSRQQMAEAAKLSQELNKKAEEEKAAKLVASQSSPQTPSVQRIKREYATNEGAFTAWYWESLKDFNVKKEARAEAHQRLEAEAKLAHSKASKNHEIDPSKVSASTSSSQASSSSSLSSEEGKGKEDLEKLVLGSHHFKAFERLITDKNCEYDVEDLINVFTALGGHVDPHRDGSTVAGYVRHIDTGQVIHFSVHYHSKNGRKTLRPEQVEDIQKTLIQGEYTLDRVLKNIGADYENTVSSASSSIYNTSSTSSTSSSASSSASTSSTSAPSSNNNNDDDGEQ